MEIRDTKTLTDLVGHLRELSRVADKLKGEMVSSPEKMYEFLKYFVESYRNMRPVPDGCGALVRNMGMRIICEQLQKLQDELPFQSPYIITYEEKRK